MIDRADGLHVHLRRKDIFIQGLDTLSDPRYDGILLGKIFTIGISSLEGGRRNAACLANIHPGWIKFSMAVLQPGFPLPRAKYLYFIFSSENISAKGFFRRGRSLSASRKKFGKGERYEEESHDASHLVSPCFAYAFQSKSAERSDASKFPHVKGTDLR